MSNSWSALAIGASEVLGHDLALVIDRARGRRRDLDRGQVSHEISDTLRRPEAVLGDSRHSVGMRTRSRGVNRRASSGPVLIDATSQAWPSDALVAGESGVNDLANSVDRALHWACDTNRGRPTYVKDHRYRDSEAILRDSRHREGVRARG